MAPATNVVRTSGTHVWAIDPGGEHCGLCVDTGGDPALVTYTWEPQELIAALEIASPRLIVIELFVLYPWEAASQAWKTFREIEVIGVCRYLAWKKGVEFIEQPANIKKVVAGHMRARGIKMVGKTIHEQDAECHYWHWRLKTKGGKPE